ncbi:hypothetical protein [uncultured Sphingomonas sp.]|uniref:hypothetical protein n=1 Tax=uncultured Sphingomonas sp. TaxID=158754 RepID=UPI0035CBA714
MKRTATELSFLALGLLAGFALTWACAWSYPLGADVIRTCGGLAMLAAVLMDVPPLRRAWARDRAGA